MAVGSGTQAAESERPKAVICKECQKAGLQSRVFVVGSSMTLAYTAPFYDEKGNRHVHDPNATATSYRCDNGHEWSESSRSSCWCGWPEKKESKS